ncbi:glycosyltransferase family 4 protein, partial [Prochlorococcus sp. AH-716-J21]|nr:glycosyltransferase family 4 protein [Prochlorococcus sp. AH-716-J21]
SLVLTLSKGMKQTITKKYSLSNALIINPWVDTKIIKPLDYSKNKYAKDYVPSDKFVVLYSGNMGLAHDIDTILEAAKILKDDKKILFLLIGEGPGYEKVRKFIFNFNIKNLKLFPFQEQKKLKYTLPLASISLVSLNSGLEDFLIPSKTFFYLSAGSPLISISNLKSELSNLIIKNKIGLVSNPGDSNELARKIKELQSDPNRLKEMKKNARELVKNNFSKEIVLSDFIKLLIKAKLIPNINLEKTN